ncbi:MAG: NifB/NifX family molybdenum-iron cluster-binding protein [Candidatus Thorarchaeota archaeon]
MDVRTISLKIVIPVEDEGGLAAVLSAHFGRAPFFAVIEKEEEGKIESVNMVSNRGQHTGGRGLPAQNILALQPDIVISTGMGRRAIDIFQQNGVGVLQAPPGTVDATMKLFGEDKLPELTEGCVHAKH